MSGSLPTIANPGDQFWVSPAIGLVLARGSVTLAADTSVEQQERKRDLRCLHTYAKSMEIDSIIVYGTRYSYDNIGKLPHDLTLENAKIVEVQVVMLSKAIMHTYLSGLYEREITFRDSKHKSAEHTFHFTRADGNKQPELASSILEAKTLYNAMKLGKRVKMSEEYKNECTTSILT